MLELAGWQTVYQEDLGGPFSVYVNVMEEALSNREGLSCCLKAVVGELDRLLKGEDVDYI